MSTQRAERGLAAHDQVVTYESGAGIAVITLNRPHRLNAVVPELVERLCAALGQARHDDVAACILTGAGRSFCAGHDLRQEHEPISEAEDRRRLHRIQDVTRLVRQEPFPVISAVHGYALGAGCEFALCCDLIVASTDATFAEVGIEAAFETEIAAALALHAGADAQDAARAFRDRDSRAGAENSARAENPEKDQ